MFSKKGKRKIVVDGETYFWCVSVDKETGIEPITLRVFSEDKYLFGNYFEHENKRWVYAPGPNPFNGRFLVLGKAPEITPSVVRELILKYRQKQYFYRDAELWQHL